MSIQLHNLVEYSLNCYKDDNKHNPDKDIKKNLSKFKNNEIFNYNFSELNLFIDKNNVNISFNDMVLISPIYNEEYFNQCINCLLLIDNDNYINKNNYEKLYKIKEIYKTLDYKNFNYENINTLFNSYNYNLIIINDGVKIYSNHYEKYIIIIKIDDEYFPLYNINNKYFDNNNQIIKEINNNYNVKEDDKIECIDLQTYDDYKLEISEMEQKEQKYKILDTIFICEDDTQENNETEIFNKTCNLTNDDKLQLISSIKKTHSLEKIQEIAIKLDIPIISGMHKNGKPKNRKKDDIYNNIKDYTI